MLIEVQIALFSRPFLRRRAISAATTLAVTAASLAFGHQSAELHRVHPALSVQQIAARPASAETQPLRASRIGPVQRCDLRVRTFEPTETSAPSPSPG
jgi:hypothetical protein